MKDSQLEKMSIEDLRDLVDRAQAQITAKQQQAKIEMRERFAKEAQAAGFSIADLIPGGRKGGKSGKARSNGTALFQHPDNPSLTWGGRGRKPKWLSEAGANIERFRVR